MEVEVAGASVRLLPKRAAFLPAHGTLLVADAHIGKALSFRRLGVPVPGGTTAAALASLSHLLRTTCADRVVFLGDLLHSSRSQAPATEAAVAAWRERHMEVELVLVRGNHDQQAGDPPPAWRVSCVDGPLHLPPFALSHHPVAAADAYVLAGHVHPAVVLRGGGARDRLRLPCFHFGPAVGVLPAFGDFTGTHVLPRRPGDRVYAIAQDEVHEVPGLNWAP